MNFKELGRKIENLGTFFAFTIQGQHKEIDLVPPLPEPTQQAGWRPERLVELASGKQEEQKT